MIKPIIEIHSLSKKYQIREHIPYYSLRDEITKLFKRKKSSNSEFWALRNVSLNIEAGEFLGIVGSNGAGKSTLLKLLSRVTFPTFGKIILRGRMASLLEVGTGFHPELTGRENILLYGAILGMKKSEIKMSFDKIVSFAEIRSFLDTPIKHYSSGMYTRLAFSVAVHMHPEILVIDEVLAVGDASFQKKCIGKMEELSQSGCTILFVSHNMSLISSLCKRSILLDKGRILALGKTEMIVAKYLKKSSTSIKPIKKRKDRTGNGQVRLSGIKITNHKNEEVIGSFEGIRIILDLHFKKKLTNFEVKMAFMDPSGKVLFRVDSDLIKRKNLIGDKLIFETDPIPLAPTLCVVNIGIFADGVISDYLKNVYSFDIIYTYTKNMKSYTGDMATILIGHKVVKE